MEVDSKVQQTIAVVQDTSSSASRDSYAEAGSSCDGDCHSLPHAGWTLASSCSHC